MYCDFAEIPELLLPLKHSINISPVSGTLSLILQLSLVDVASLYVAITEILTLNKQTWSFSSDLCPLYKGTEILINSLTLYLIVAVNFHVISLWNLHEWDIGKSSRNPLTTTTTLATSPSSSFGAHRNNDDSNECLVTKQENRIVTIDYRKRQNDVSVVFPIIFVWFVGLSLSIPSYTLSSTLRLDVNCTLCAIIDVYYGRVLQYLLLVFKIIVPVALLMLSLVLLVVKLCHTSKQDIETVLTKKFCEIRLLLIFGISMTVLYGFTSLPRQFLHVAHIVSYQFDDNSVDNFKMPPLFNNYMYNSASSVYCALLYYSGAVFRALLYLFVLPKFRYLVRSKIFICCAEKNI